MSHSSRASILLIEDEPVTAELVREGLEADGYQVRHAATGGAGLAVFDSLQPDLVLLDLMLPDIDGLVVCTNLRAASDVPIIICSGTHRRWETVLGLKLGADDFVLKPFDPDELEARVEVVLRRRRVRHLNRRPTSSEVRVGHLQVDRRMRRITLDGQSLRLSSVEFDLLWALATRPNDTVSREELARAAWGDKNERGERTVEGRIRRLRAKLAAAGEAPAIVAVRGFGYRLIDNSMRATG